jgi:hypothetical protein
LVRWSRRIRMQIDKDSVLSAASACVYTRAEWHFFISARAGMVGVDPKVLDYLTSKGHPFVVHVGWLIPRPMDLGAGRRWDDSPQPSEAR